MDLMVPENSTNTRPEHWYRNWFFLIMSVLPFVCFFGFLLYDYIFNEPPARKAQAVLETEFAQVKTPSWVSFEGKTSSHKPGQALVDATYSTTSVYQNIRRYYDRELIRNGWRFVGKEKLRDWGRDFGGSETYYRKNDYIADLQYAGEKANYGWTYSLAFSWGMDDPELEIRGGWNKLSIPAALFFLGFFLPLAFWSIYSFSTQNGSSFEKAVKIILFFMSLACAFWGAYSLWPHIFGR